MNKSIPSISVAGRSIKKKNTMYKPARNYFFPFFLFSFFFFSFFSLLSIPHRKELVHLVFYLMHERACWCISLIIFHPNILIEILFSITNRWIIPPLARPQRLPSRFFLSFVFSPSQGLCIGDIQARQQLRIIAVH